MILQSSITMMLQGFSKYNRCIVKLAVACYWDGTRSSSGLGELLSNISQAGLDLKPGGDANASNGCIRIYLGRNIPKENIKPYEIVDPKTPDKNWNLNVIPLCYPCQRRVNWKIRNLKILKVLPYYYIHLITSFSSLNTWSITVLSKRNEFVYNNCWKRYVSNLHFLFTL